MELIKSAFASVLTFILFLLGGWDVALQTLCIFIVADYITGLIKAYHLKIISSKIGMKGILKKLGILTLVGVACALDRLTGDSGAIRTLVIYYFVANEGVSILENIGQAGVPIPEKLKEALIKLKGEDDVDTDKNA